MTSLFLFAFLSFPAMIAAMKTIVKIDPEKEYISAKNIVESISSRGDLESETSSLGESIDNLKTVINVLIERSAPKKRSRPPRKNKRKRNRKKCPRDFDKLPSEKFPDLEVEDKIVESPSPPICECCNNEMKESGLYKTSEKLEVIPKQYHIVRLKRVIYNCGKCNGSMVNTPSVPSISPSSNYGDSVVLDVALSKYCDLIPMERYSAMAARNGVPGLPPNSLIGLTHTLADFLDRIYFSLGREVKTAKIVLGDETPHKMLEGDVTSSWYLWGFSSIRACVFEAHGTRSGDVPIKFLSDSMAKYLVTDGYSGYKRALRELNADGKRVVEVFCNAHAYRYFEEASVTWESECQVFLELYGKIYELERNADTDKEKRASRRDMKPLFKQLSENCKLAKADVMPSSKLEKAINYFLNHYTGLTECLNDIDLPLDNNFSERLLRSPVVGRKTWYGTHSKRGARTNAILFSIVESCKLNDINPRCYFPWVVEQLHKGKEPLTPFQYSEIVDSG